MVKEGNQLVKEGNQLVDVAEEVVEEPDDEDLSPAMKDMYDFLGRLSERIQSFKDKSTNPGQPPAVPDDVQLQMRRM